MKLKMKISKGLLADKIQVQTESNEVAFDITTKKVSIGKEVSVRDALSNQTIDIKEEALSFSPQYKLIENSKVLAEITGTPKNKSAKMQIDKLDYVLDGNLKKMTFNILDKQANQLASINTQDEKQFEINIDDEKNALQLLTVCVAIYCLNTTDDTVYGGTAF